jgi:hypothetical protein
MNCICTNMPGTRRAPGFASSIRALTDLPLRARFRPAFTMASSTPQSQRATVFIAASEIDANLYYATKFIAPDPFIYLEIKGERILVMSDLEMDRAKSQSSVDRVLSYSEVEGRAKTQGIAEPGTVRVERLFDVEKYPTLWQMTSTVAARTRAPFAAILGALFPAASITGAVMSFEPTT